MPIAMPVVWLIAVVIFVIAEAATMGLTSIWFACGALVAMIAALLGVGLWWQLALFAAGSAVLLATTRKWVGKLKLGKKPTNADRIVGQKAVVIQEIHNQMAQGQDVYKRQLFFFASHRVFTSHIATSMSIIA